MCKNLLIVLAIVADASATRGAVSPLPVGNVSAVYDLVGRILPGHKDEFSFSLAEGACRGNVEVCLHRNLICLRVA